MNPVYFTLTGTQHYFGTRFLEPGMQLRLVKDPENPHDREAIRVELPGLGLIGYVANSPYTTIGESISAGRLYDHIPQRASGRILYVTDKGALCRLNRSVRVKVRIQAEEIPF